MENKKCPCSKKAEGCHDCLRNRPCQCKLSPEKTANCLKIKKVFDSESDLADQHLLGGGKGNCACRAGNRDSDRAGCSRKTEPKGCANACAKCQPDTQKYGVVVKGLLKSEKSLDVTGKQSCCGKKLAKNACCQKKSKRGCRCPSPVEPQPSSSGRSVGGGSSIDTYPDIGQCCQPVKEAPPLCGFGKNNGCAPQKKNVEGPKKSHLNPNDACCGASIQKNDSFLAGFSSEPEFEKGPGCEKDSDLAAEISAICRICDLKLRALSPPRRCGGLVLETKRLTEVGCARCEPKLGIGREKVRLEPVLDAFAENGECNGKTSQGCQSESHELEAKPCATSCKCGEKVRDGLKHEKKDAATAAGSVQISIAKPSKPTPTPETSPDRPKKKGLWARIKATFSGKRNKNKGENAARQAEAKEAKKKAKAEKKAKQKESKKRHGDQRESQRDHSGGSKILSWSVLNVKRPSESSGPTASK